MIVVKVGGSLFDHPGLGPGLRAWQQQFGDEDVLFVPGGGRVADAVRELDAVHRLSQEHAHWVALRSLSVTAEVLHALLDEAVWVTPVANDFREHRRHRLILDAHQFALNDDHRRGSLPHTWDVTSDSIAARAAVVGKADKLVLLKSIDIPPGTPWETAAANGWVDPHFPRVIAGTDLRVEAINFRRRLDTNSS